MRTKSFAKRSLKLSTAIAALGLMAGFAANADEARRCLDQHCRMISIPIMGAAAAPEGTIESLTRRYGTWGVDLTGMDAKVAPGDDFFQYVNGTALKNTVIPGDQVGYGVSFVLNDLSELQTRSIVEKVAADPKTAEETKIANLYKGMLDQKTKDKLGITPLKTELAAIHAIKTRKDMAAFMGATMGDFGSSIFDLGIYDDEKNPKIMVLHMSQGGLSLPDRDYYLEKSFADKKAKYLAYVTEVLIIAGDKTPAVTAKAIVAFETRIAKVSWTRTESRDDNKMYDLQTLDKLPALAPGFDWAGFFKAAEVDKAERVIVGNNTAIPKIAKIFAETPLETLKAWEIYKTTNGAAPYLSNAIYMKRWTFFAKTLYGTEAPRPLWKRSLGLVEDNMGEALGKAYVTAYFPESSKKQVAALVDDLKLALKARIDNLSWMSADTKAKAQAKLATFGVKVGYPDKWRDYSALEVKSGDLVGNVKRAAAFSWDHQVSKLDKPIDPTEWFMTPQTVNAYYVPTRNEIVFPAAILQPPYFDPKADAAVNYAAIGGTIGHEITHGFDDSGRHYDGDGSLKEWWTEEDSQKFEKAAEKFGQQYDTYEPVPGTHLQGKLTMGENIADLGGLLVAYDAYHLSLKGAAAPVIDGWTGDQRFFLGYSQSWQGKYRDDFLKSISVSDEHSPDNFRVIGVVRNIDAWYEAFKIKPTEKYYLKPEDRVKIW